MLKAKAQIRTYELPHFANQAKTDLLWQLYEVYKSEYKIHIHHYWKSFKSNKIIQFSHLGSTKNIKTNLNASYLQGCLAQACASLNNYLANIETKIYFRQQSSKIRI